MVRNTLARSSREPGFRSSASRSRSSWSRFSWLSTRNSATISSTASTLTPPRPGGRGIHRRAALVLEEGHPSARRTGPVVSECGVPAASAEGRAALSEVVAVEPEAVLVRHHTGRGLDDGPRDGGDDGADPLPRREVGLGRSPALPLVRLRAGPAHLVSDERSR